MALRCSGFLAGLALVWEPVLAGENRQSGPLASARPGLRAGGERQQGTPKLWWSPLLYPALVATLRKEEHPPAYPGAQGQHGLPGLTQVSMSLEGPLPGWSSRRDRCSRAGWEGGGQGGVQSGGRVCGTPQGIRDPTSSSNGVPGLEVPLGDGAAGGAVRGPKAFLLWGLGKSSTVALGPAVPPSGTG